MASVLGVYDLQEVREEGEIGWMQEYRDMYKPNDASGPAISDNMAETVQQIMAGRLPEERKNLIEKQKRLENLPVLTNPRVNSEVWKQMRDPTRTNDISFFAYCFHFLFVAMWHERSRLWNNNMGINFRPNEFMEFDVI